MVVKEGERCPDGNISLCPVSGKELDVFDCHTNGIRVGKNAILHLPSFKQVNPLDDVAVAVAELDVLSLVNLSSLSEGSFCGGKIEV